MDLTEKLRLWGSTQAQARSAERAAAQQAQPEAGEAREQARRLRERADSLHREIYGQIGRKDPRPS